MKHVYYYAIFSFVVMVHIKPVLPSVVYDFCVQQWRRLFAGVRFLRIKFSKN
jgi:hypothetical protein